MQTLSSSINHRTEMLTLVAKRLQRWKLFVTKYKLVHHTMNLFHYEPKTATAEGWVPTSALGIVEHCLNEADTLSGVKAQCYLEQLQNPSDTPPTYFQTNEFSVVFQQMVDSYGIPRYQEINPAPVSIITFPFLFAVMFGDAGHGAILLLLSLFMILFAKKLKPIARSNELIDMLFRGRWIVFLMSIFSIYTGLLYNDIFGMAFNLFGTAYNKEGVKLGSTYMFGMDPAWYGSTQRLNMYNSVKMKMSIIFGICHVRKSSNMFSFY